MTGDRGPKIYYDECIIPARGASMKRFSFVVPVILLILLNACGSPGTTEGGIFITFTPTFTPPPPTALDTSTIVAKLNSTIETAETITPIAELEQTMGARYKILDVTFLQEKDGTSTFQVKTNCECAANGQCCSHEQTFIKTMRAIYLYKDQIIGLVSLVSEPVKYMNVLCYDHESQYVVMHVLWNDVEEFLSGRLTGSQLASRVHHN
jgi:hypothetical protein